MKRRSRKDGRVQRRGHKYTISGQLYLTGHRTVPRMWPPPKGWRRGQSYTTYTRKIVSYRIQDGSLDVEQRTRGRERAVKRTAGSLMFIVSTYTNILILIIHLSSFGPTFHKFFFIIKLLAKKCKNWSYKEKRKEKMGGSENKNVNKFFSRKKMSHPSPWSKFANTHNYLK